MPTFACLRVQVVATVTCSAAGPWCAAPWLVQPACVLAGGNKAAKGRVGTARAKLGAPHTAAASETGFRPPPSQRDGLA